jgi:hypothetical protein
MFVRARWMTPQQLPGTWPPGHELQDTGWLNLNLNLTHTSRMQDNEVRMQTTENRPAALIESEFGTLPGLHLLPSSATVDEVKEGAQG